MLFDYLKSVNPLKFIISVLVSLIVLIFGLLGLLLANFNVYKLNNTGLSGVVHKVGENWGIEGASYPHHKISVHGLPDKYQKEGAKVTCTIIITDVTGGKDWDVNAGVKDCAETK